MNWDLVTESCKSDGIDDDDDGDDDDGDNSY